MHLIQRKFLLTYCNKINLSWTNFHKMWLKIQNYIWFNKIYLRICASVPESHPVDLRDMNMNLPLLPILPIANGPGRWTPIGWKTRTGTSYTVHAINLCQHPLRWRHNEHDGVSNHQPHHCLLNRLFRRRSKKTSKLRVTGLCVGNSPVTGEFPAQRASNTENASIWWRHHDKSRANCEWNVLIPFQKPLFFYHQNIYTNYKYNMHKANASSLWAHIPWDCAN